MKKLFKKIGVRHLLIAFMFMYLLDVIHRNYLARQYTCAVSDLYDVVGFYWLSPVFGIVDLMLGIMILLKTYSKLESEAVKIIIFEFPIPIRNSILHAGINLNWLKRKLSRLSGGFIAFISISSLIMDVILFLQK